jgi:hypothetical protein
MSEWREEIGGGYHDRWDGIIDNPCPRCHAEAGEKCRNPLSDKPAHLPCIKRLVVSV